MIFTGAIDQLHASGGDALQDEADWHPHLRRLLAYWRSIHPADGVLPGRQHVDPFDIRDILPWVWMVDIRRDPLRFRYRLLGTAHYEPMGGDFTGQWMDEAHPNFVGSHVYKDYAALAEQGIISYRKGRPAFHTDGGCMMLERVQLPLASSGRIVDMLIAVTVYMTRDGTAY